MARPLREALGGFVYHTLNRGNARAEIFSKPGDYEAFEKVLAAAAVKPIGRPRKKRAPKKST